MPPHIISDMTLYNSSYTSDEIHHLSLKEGFLFYVSEKGARSFVIFMCTLLTPIKTFFRIYNRNFSLRCVPWFVGGAFFALPVR